MLIFTAIAAIFLRIYLISRDSIPFAYDMGRDLLWTKDIAFYHTPTLIGPAASIWGVYFGPFWYYFLSIPLLLANGNPVFPVLVSGSTIVLTGIFAFVLFRKYLGKTSAFVLMALILFSAKLINISTFAFHANLLPLLTLLTIYFCYLSVIKNKYYIAASLLSTSLMFSADPAPAIVFLAIPLFVYFKFKLFKKGNILKTIILSAASFILPLLPQMLFELRNNFIETKALLAYFSGTNHSLSGSLPLLERIPNRLEIYFDLFRSSFIPTSNFFAACVLIVLVIGLVKFYVSKKNIYLEYLFKLILYSFVLTFLIFTFVTNLEIKDWYLHGVIILMSFLVVFALYPLKSNKNVLIPLITLFTFVNILPAFSSKKIQQARSDPATLRNQLQAVDIVYGDNASTYSVYVFSPPIYDLNYQYIFWWQGVRKNRGLPSDFAYLPNAPDYVRNKKIYTQGTREENTIYLIIENAPANQFYSKSDWLANFRQYRVVWQKNINDAIIVEKRIRII